MMSRIQLTPSMIKMLLQGISPEGLGIRVVTVVRPHNTVDVRLEIVTGPNDEALAIIGERNITSGDSVTLMDIAECFKITVGNGHLV